MTQRKSTETRPIEPARSFCTSSRPLMSIEVTVPSWVTLRRGSPGTLTSAMQRLLSCSEDSETRDYGLRGAVFKGSEAIVFLLRPVI